VVREQFHNLPTRFESARSLAAAAGAGIASGRNAGRCTADPPPHPEERSTSPPRCPAPSRRSRCGCKQGGITPKTRQIAERSIAEDLTPLHYMLAVMRDEQAPERRYGRVLEPSLSAAGFRDGQSSAIGACSTFLSVPRRPPDAIALSDEGDGRTWL
jgi:hypothetical protein